MTLTPDALLALLGRPGVDAGKLARVMSSFAGITAPPPPRREPDPVPEPPPHAPPSDNDEGWVERRIPQAEPAKPVAVPAGYLMAPPPVLRFDGWDVCFECRTWQKNAADHRCLKGVRRA